MAGWLVRSVLKTRKAQENYPLLTKENKRLHKTVTGLILFKSLYSVVIVIFLGLSCAGGDEGQIGRTWFTRLSIIEAIVNPILIALKKKRFQEDSLRILHKCSCCLRYRIDSASLHGCEIDSEVRSNAPKLARFRTNSQISPIQTANGQPVQGENDPTKPIVETKDESTSTRKPSTGWM